MRTPACSALLLLALAFEVRAELTIEGIDDELERNVRAYSAIASEPCDAPASTVRRRYRGLAGETREALEPFGYYAPRIETTLEFGENCWSASVTVDR